MLIKLKIKNYWLLFLLITLPLYHFTTVLLAEDFKYIAKPKIITPASSPGRNDVFLIDYSETEREVNPSGKIFTLTGVFVSDMYDSGYPSYKIIWNGKYRNTGEIVPSGIYIYQIEVEGQVFNGTVVVAK